MNSDVNSDMKSSTHSHTNSEMKLDVYLDLGNIAGYLSIEAVKALVIDSQVTCRYLPIKGIVPRPLSREPRANDDDQLAAFKHLRWQAKYRFEQEELRRDCDRLGLSMDLAQRHVDAKLSHEALLFVSTHCPNQSLDFVEAVYRARFRDGNDLLDQAAIQLVFEKCSIEGSGFFEKQAEATESFAQHMLQTLELGIHDSPCFMLNGEPFQGRQHLPLMRWRIEGEMGTPPV